MSTPNQAYNSGAVPNGGLIVTVKRGQSAPVTLGSYKVESCNPVQGSTLNKRPDIDQGPNGWWLVNGEREGSATLQLATDDAPTLENGDFFDAAIRRDAAGDPVTERFVLHQMGIVVGAGEYRKQSGSVIVDAAADV